MGTLSLQHENFGPDSVASGMGCVGVCCHFGGYIKQCLGNVNLMTGSVDLLFVTFLQFEEGHSPKTLHLNVLLYV